MSAFDDLVGHHVDVLLHYGVVELAADEALHREEGVLRIGDRLALGRLADEDFAVLGEGDDGRRGAVAFAVLDDARLAAFHDGDAGIGGAQVDADYLAHIKSPTNSFWVLTRGPFVEARSFVSRRTFNSALRRRHDHARRPQQSAVQLVAALHHRQHRVRRRIAAAAPSWPRAVPG